MKKGFTLIELMVTIAIIGILAAIALPRFTGVTREAEVAQIKANKKNIETALAMYMVKEEKEVGDLFKTFPKAEGGTQTLEESFSYFYKYYSKSELPVIQGTSRKKVVQSKENDKEGLIKPKLVDGRWNVLIDGKQYPTISRIDEEDMLRMVKTGNRWIITRDGRKVYPKRDTIHNEKDIKMLIRMGYGWIFTDNGDVYPVVEEETYGIKWNEF